MALTILLRDLIRLKRRKTRKARSMRSSESGPRSVRLRLMQPLRTTMKSNQFHHDRQKAQNQLPYLRGERGNEEERRSEGPKGAQESRSA